MPPRKGQTRLAWGELEPTARRRAHWASVNHKRRREKARSRPGRRGWACVGCVWVAVYASTPRADGGVHWTWHGPTLIFLQDSRRCPSPYLLLEDGVELHLLQQLLFLVGEAGVLVHGRALAVGMGRAAAAVSAGAGRAAKERGVSRGRMRRKWSFDKTRKGAE